MRKKLFWIVGSVVVVILITTAVLIFANPFSKRTEQALIVENPGDLSYQWSDELPPNDPLKPINYLDPEITNKENYDSIYKYDVEVYWSKDIYNASGIVTDKPDEICRMLSSIKERQVYYVKPEDSFIDVNKGDLVVLSTLNNPIEIPSKCETVNDGSNTYKMKILIAVNYGKQSLEFIKITDKGEKVESSVTVNVKKRER